VITKLAIGGAQETVLRICAGLDRERFRSLLVTGPEVDAEGDLFAEAARAGVRVEVVDQLVRRISPARDAAAVWALYRLMRRERPSIVHTHSSKAGLLGRAAAIGAHTPAIVHTQHGWALQSQSRRAVWTGYRVAERTLARSTDRIVVVTDRDRATGLRHGIGRPEQYTIVRSGVDVAGLAGGPERRAGARARFGLPLEVPIIGAVTRLARVKDPETLIRAFALVHARRPAARLVLVGDGSLRGSCETLVAQLGLADRVVFAGVRRDVAEILPAFDVTALSSLDEGLPRTILESMATGVPVVATAVGGVPEVVIDDVTGLLVPRADPPALAQALRRVLDDPPLGHRLATSARDLLGGFDVSTMVRQTEVLYAELVGDR
jgi:glycosyltransferase involved in cell wall biosynthesis